ncbi:MAG: response regulator [Candidatus Marinimicrobia bacterium]|nr:response regulator [Candidatus Neomarinimicrobiota bacterium]
MSDDKKKIMVIDDEPLILNISQEIIAFLGYECVTAEDGNIAMKILSEVVPDLILLDFYLPNMPGEKILENILTKYPDYKELTASGRELNDDEYESIKEKGAIGFLYKPYTINELKETLQKHLGN